MNALPRIDTRYWLTLCAASVFGTNTGDFVADSLHIGHAQGLPWLLAVFLVVLGLARLLPLKAPVWFWLAIIVVRTAATNLGDAWHQAHLGFDVSLPVTSMVFAAAVLVYRQRGGGVRADGTASVDAMYWLCMLLAGAWGTVGGDFAAFALAHSAAVGTVLTTLVLALAFLGGRGGRLLQPMYYWLVVGLVRVAGTCGGDALGDVLNPHDILPATLLSGAVFAALVVGFYVVAPRRAVATA